MKICIEESTYEGTPIKILTQLRAMHFDLARSTARKDISVICRTRSAA